MTDTIQCNVLGMQKSTPDPNPRTGPNKKAHILHGIKQHQRQNQAETNEEEQTVRINFYKSKLKVFFWGFQKRA